MQACFGSEGDADGSDRGLGATPPLAAATAPARSFKRSFADLARVADTETSKARARVGTPSAAGRSRDSRLRVCRENADFVAQNLDLVSPCVHLPVLPRVDMAESARLPSVAVVHGDVLLTAKTLLSPGYSVGILSFADAVTRGGGYQEGSLEPEGELCRRLVTLYPALGKAWYPIDRRGLVVTNLWERRAEGDYHWLATPSGPFTVVSTGLPNISGLPPATDTSSPWLERFRKIVKYNEGVTDRVAEALRSFASMGCTRIVLGACGPQHCDDLEARGTRAVAQALAECLKQGHHFDMVFIAIPGADRDRGKLPEAYHVFADELSAGGMLSPQPLPPGPAGGPIPFTSEGWPVEAEA